jgi:D-lactate dehydrogenase (cytochrome)
LELKFCSSPVQALQEIRSVTSEETISTDDDDLKRHGYSEWATYNIERLPIAVAYPKSTEEVSKIAKICHKYRVPMIPYSGGSVC